MNKFPHLQPILTLYWNLYDLYYQSDYFCKFYRNDKENFPSRPISTITKTSKLRQEIPTKFH